jgi:adenosylhomocysteine nucleosidase
MTSDQASNAAPLTGIVAAMEEEVVDVKARMAGARRAPVAGARVTLGWLGTTRVALAVTGDGERNARQGLSALLSSQPVSRIIVIGVAGGLGANLDFGALVIADRIINEADGSVSRGDDALAAAAAGACGARRGVAVTATRIADTADEKRRLLALATATVGESVAAVVDLESAGFAAIATRAQVPWMVLRAVSDTATDAVPALLNRSRTEGGAVDRRSVAWGLLTNPRALLPLLMLRDRVRTCAGHLARAVERTIVALSSGDGKEKNFDGA